jgi:alpha-1,3-mannosyltransferase
VNYTGDPTLLANATAYVHAIMHPDDDTLPRLECPRLDEARYNHLQPKEGWWTSEKKKRHYFFALNIRQKVHLLPRLMGSIVEAVRFLGPQRCVVSVVEGNSDDGTYEVLRILQDNVETLGARFHLRRSTLDPGLGNRVALLARLRNAALAPLLDHADDFHHADDDAAVIFLNDVAACADDILELVLQRRRLGADMTCAMDWTYVGPDPTFYDVWIARTMGGDTFFEIPPNGSWDQAWNLFWNAPAEQARLHAHQPFQVFSCWNGAAAIAARPLLERRVAFRSPLPGECFQGEPQLFCKDMWHVGFSKIAVVPSVNLEYDDDAGRKIKALKGFTGQSTLDEDESYRIEWRPDPPEKVKCMPADYARQEWRPWDETLEITVS